MLDLNKESITHIEYVSGVDSASRLDFGELINLPNSRGILGGSKGNCRKDERDREK